MDNDPVKKLKANLLRAAEAAVEGRQNDERRRIASSLGQDIAKMLTPFLTELSKSAKANKEDVREMMHELAAAVNAREMPGVDTGAIIQAIYSAFSGVKMPEPKVQVNMPKMDFPALKWPDGEMPVRGWMKLMGVDLENPLPVQLRDAKGRPVSLDIGSVPIMGGNSGKMDYFTIKGFSQSAFSELMNADGRVKVELPAGGSGLTDAELRASAVPVSQVSGANWSVTASLDTTAALYNGDNRLRVSVETGGSGLTDAELRASAVPVAQVSGSSWSTEARIVAISDVFSTTAASVVVNPDNRVRTELPSTTIVQGITNTVAANLSDSSGVGYSGSNPFPVTATLSGSLASTVATGPTAADAVDDGSAPVQQGGIARQTNPTPVADGDVVKKSMDDIGRTLMRPVQVRDLTLTAYVQLTTGSETTLKGSIAGAYQDLIYLMGANASDAAVSVDIRAVTGGGVVMTLQIPASGTAGIACPVPLPQQETGNNWTADMPDITGTTVSLTALFSREV